MMFDVISLGYAAVDYLGVVPHLPELDTKMFIPKLVVQGGGPAATAAVAAARLGAKTAFVGRVGEDEFAEFTIRDFAKEGIDTSHVEKIAGGSSLVAFVMVDQETGKRTILWTRSDIPPLDPVQLDREFITSCKVLHLDRHEPAAATQAAKWVREAGGIVSLDAGTYAADLVELLPHVDVFIVSRDFALGATGKSDPMDAARDLLEDHRAAGVTCGDCGSYFVTRDGEFHVPSFKVNVVDTTGAGDVFHGAFAFGLSQGWDARRCATFASATAALKCAKLGGRTGIPSRAEVEALIGH